MICPYLLSLFGDGIPDSRCKILDCRCWWDPRHADWRSLLILPASKYRSCRGEYHCKNGGSPASRLAVALPSLILCSSSYLYEPSPNPHVIEAQETVYGHLEVRKHGTVEKCPRKLFTHPSIQPPQLGLRTTYGISYQSSQPQSLVCPTKTRTDPRTGCRHNGRSERLSRRRGTWRRA